MGERALVLPLHDPDRAVAAIVEHDRGAPLDAVVAVDDPGVVVAAEAARRLGLHHIDPGAARCTRDKLAMREAFAAAEVPQPRFVPLPSSGEAQRGAAFDALTFPVVCKPRGLSASRGVLRVDRPEDLPSVEDRIRRILVAANEPADAPLVVEEFVPGPEVSVEAILRRGQLRVLAVFDKPDPLDGPTFEETLYVTPSRHPADAVAEVERTVATAARALGLDEGPVHAEARLGPDGVRVLEIAARSIGGLCSRALRFGIGVSLEEVILRHALDLDAPLLVPERAASGVMMLPIRQRGVLRGVEGRDAALAVPGVWGLEVTIPPGREIVPLPEGDRYLGFLFARGEGPAAVERALRRAYGELRVRVDPLDRP